MCGDAAQEVISWQFLALTNRFLFGNALRTDQLEGERRVNCSALPKSLPTHRDRRGESNFAGRRKKTFKNDVESNFGGREVNF